MSDRSAGLVADLDAPLSPWRAVVEVLEFVAGIVLVWFSMEHYEAIGAGAAGPFALLLVTLPVCVLAAVIALRIRERRWRLPWLGFALGTTLAFLIALPALPELARRRPFDAHAWRSIERGRGRDRIRMVDHLLISGALEGKTRAQVEALLGPDDTERGTGWGRGYFSNWGSVYWLGPERGFFSIDSEWLVLDYGASGVVSEYRIVTD